MLKHLCCLLLSKDKHGILLSDKNQCIKNF